MAETQQNWDACPDGALTRLSQNLRAARRREVMRQTAPWITVGAVLVLAAAWLTWPRSGAEGPLVCAEVMQMLPDYRANRLTGRMRKRVEVHLAGCPACRQRAERQAEPAGGSTRRPGIDRAPSRGIGREFLERSAAARKVAHAPRPRGW